MRQNAAVLQLLSLLLQAALLFLGLLILYLLSLSMLNPLGVLPEKFQTTIELPVQLHQLESFYPVEVLDESVQFEKYEIRGIDMEVLPKPFSLPYFLMYAYGILYLGGFWGMLFLLLKIIKSFRGAPFPLKNVGRIQKIAGLLVFIVFLQFGMSLAVRLQLGSSFEVQGGRVDTYSALGQINGLALFVALLLLVLAEVFRRGAELQEFESQTV